MRIAEIAGNERRGMELRATGFCLALLWGCALAAAATQGKEGECLRGGHSQQGPRATDPGSWSPALLSGTYLWKLTCGCLARWVRWGSRAAVGDNLGDPLLGLQALRY